VDHVLEIGELEDEAVGHGAPANWQGDARLSIIGVAR
jgi:hypothetical protein